MTGGGIREEKEREIIVYVRRLECFGTLKWAGPMKDWLGAGFVSRGLHGCPLVGSIGGTRPIASAAELDVSAHRASRRGIRTIGFGTAATPRRVRTIHLLGAGSRADDESAARPLPAVAPSRGPQ